MAALDDEIEIEITKEGDPWRNVIVGKIMEYYDFPPVPYPANRVKVYDIPVRLELAANSRYAVYTKADTDLQYQYQYTITITDPGFPGREVEAMTTYSASPEVDQTPIFHALTPVSTGVEGLGMSGHAKVYELPGQPKVGLTLDLVLRERDASFGGPFEVVPDASQTIYLGEDKGKFLVSLSDDFFEHKYIWWWGEEQTVRCYKCTLGYVPGILLPVPVPDVTIPPIKKVVKQGEVAEFTSADGLKEGWIYVFGIDFFHAVDQAVNGLAYKFDNTVQNVYLVPVPGVGNSICPLLGVDPKSYECTLELAEFLDPVYVANTLRKIVEHKDIAGNSAEPDMIDYIFLPIALLSGLVPGGTLGKKLAGPILKATKKASVVDNWIEKNKELIHAAIIRGDNINIDVALDRVKGATKAVEGSVYQKSLLDEATNLLDDVILDSKLTKEDIAQKQKFFVEEIGKKLDDVKSKTTVGEVIEKSGLKNAAHVVPGIKALSPKDVSVLKKVLNLLIGKRPTLVEIEGELCELVSYSIREGKLTKNWKPFAPGFWGWLKRERLRATIFGAAIVMFPWWFADNLVFLIYILRYADVLDKTWGEQWKKAIKTVKDAYWDMQNFGPCEEDYQAMYISGIDTMRRLLEGANPIPEGKLAKAKYNLQVCYAVHIGDPNEFVKEAAWKVLNANELTYTKLVMGCEDPLIPVGGLKTPVIPNPEYVAKIERVVDGDTFWVSSNDPTWPFKQDKQVRLLGVDTPDSDGGGFYSVRRKVIPDKDAPEDTILDVPLEAYKQATRAAELILKKQEVKLTIDLDNPYDTTEMQRILATVWVDRPATIIDGEVITEGYTGDFGEKQLAEGNSCVFFYTPNSIFGPEKRAEYMAIEKTAKDDKKGLWGTSAPSMPKGKIHCRSAPSSAWVYLDDETAPKGDTEMTISDVRIGPHTVHFRGTTACPLCSCDYDVIVKEDETVQAYCELSAIYEIAEVYWIDEYGVRQTMSAYVHPGTYLNQTSNVSEGCPMRSVCLTPPGKITFGRKYTTVDDYTPLKVEGCAAATLTDLDFGQRRIELRQSSFKTMYEVIDIKHGMHETRIAAMVKGNEEDYIEIGGVGPGKLHVIVYDGKDTLNYVRAMMSLRNIQGAEVGRAESVYQKTFSDLNAEPEYNPYTLTVIAEGFEAYSEEVTIASGSTTGLIVYLTGEEGIEVGGEGTLHVVIRDDETDDYVRALISVKDKEGIAQGKTVTSYDTTMKLPVVGSPFTLQITHDDYHTYIKSGIGIKRDYETEVGAYLTPLELQPPGTATLTIWKPYYIKAGIEEPIDYAKVFIDYGTENVLEDKFTKHISELAFIVDFGTHTIKLRAGGFNDRDMIVEILGDHILTSKGMTKIHAATIINPRTYPKDFNVGYKVMCPLTIVNASDTDATFIVSQIFEGIDVTYTMVFPSETIFVPAGAEKEVELPVTIPIEAIPVGMDIANYDIATRLEVI